MKCDYSGRRAERFRAFTLIELLVVMGVIGILAGLLLPAIGVARRIATRNAASSAVRSIEFAFDRYVDEYKKAPRVFPAGVPPVMNMEAAQPFLEVRDDV
ncbi:MAG: type II secretion system protein, partial [Kiritimatiellia bacterium]|nr:type II secretion system protein [Kiritimatiellia bacterium]